MRWRRNERAPRRVAAEVSARAAVAEGVRRAPPLTRSAVNGNACLELAHALAGQGRRGEMRAAAERAAAELDDVLGPRHRATRAADELARPPARRTAAR